jgi:hypothetical protein
MSKALLAIAMIAMSATIAPADPAPPTRTDGGERAERPAGAHAIYVDLLGRAGLWGIGYDYRPRRWLAVGAAASYYSFDGDRFTTLAPYASLYPLVRGPHAAFLQLGPSLVRRTTPSPVPEWNGMTTTRIGAELCAGYEYRRGVLIRAYAMASQGDHLVPWLGVSLGWTL